MQNALFMYETSLNLQQQTAAHSRMFSYCKSIAHVQVAGVSRVGKTGDLTVGCAIIKQRDVSHSSVDGRTFSQEYS